MTKQLSKLNKALYIILGIVIILFGISIITYLISSYSYRSARSDAINAAEKYAGIEEVSDFDLYNGSETYYTVYGKNKDNQYMLVVVPKKGKKIVAFSSDEGISPKKAQEISGLTGKNVSVTFGIENQEPIWEVKKITENDAKYVLVGFKDGQIQGS